MLLANFVNNALPISASVDTYCGTLEMRPREANSRQTKKSMKTSVVQNIGPNPLPYSSFASVRDAVVALSTPETVQRLAEIARRRLDRLAVWPAGQRLRALREPMEFVNEAVGLLLREADCAGTGRRTHVRHLESMKAFFNFVQAVVQSCISNQFKQQLRRGEHVPLHLQEASGNLIEPTTSIDVVRDIALRETTGELANQLKQEFRKQPQMREVIAEFESGGLDGNRLSRYHQSDKQMHRLRKKARQILKQMSRHEGISKPTGKEMFRL